MWGGVIISTDISEEHFVDEVGDYFRDYGAMKASRHL